MWCPPLASTDRCGRARGRPLGVEPLSARPVLRTTPLRPVSPAWLALRLVDATGSEWPDGRELPRHTDEAADPGPPSRPAASDRVVPAPAGRSFRAPRLGPATTRRSPGSGTSVSLVGSGSLLLRLRPYGAHPSCGGPRPVSGTSGRAERRSGPTARGPGTVRLRAGPSACRCGAWCLGRHVDPAPGPPRGSGRGVPSGCLRAPARPVAVAGADDRAPRSGGRNAPGNSALRGRRRLRAPERVPLRFPADPVRLSRSDPLRFGSARVDGPDRPGPGSWIGRGHALCQGRSQGGGEALVLPGLRTSSVRASGTCSGGTAGMCRPGAPPGRGNETPNGWCLTERRQARPEMSGDPEWIRCRIRDRLSVRGPVRDPFPAHPLPVRRPSPASLGSRRTVQHGVR